MRVNNVKTLSLVIIHRVEILMNVRLLNQHQPGDVRGGGPVMKGHTSVQISVGVSDCFIFGPLSLGRGKAWCWVYAFAAADEC